MAATKLLLLLFSVALLGLSSAQFSDEESQESSAQITENEDHLEDLPAPHDFVPDEQDSEEDQGIKLLSKTPDSNKKGGRRHGLSGPHGNGGPGGPGPRVPQSNRKGSSQKSEQPRDRPFVPVGNNSNGQKSSRLGAKKRALPGGQ